MSRRDEETLLIVKADPTVRRTLANFLRNDYRVLGAKLGTEAWVTLAKEPADLILFDEGVPDIKGTTSHSSIPTCSGLRR
jgi:DNA-binding response OmpR family regulator